MKLRVLCTTQILEALVAEIGGNHIETLSLVRGEVDPHSYQLVKGDREKIAGADLIFCHGLDLEHNPSLRNCLSHYATGVFLGDELARQSPNLIIMHAGSPDPHIWLDAHLFSRLCPLIANSLSKKDPPHASDYRIRALHAEQRLHDLHQTITAQFQQIDPQHRFLITSHAAFAYFTRAYLAAQDEEEAAWRMRACAPEGLAPESQISLNKIIEIVKYAQRHQVRVGFYECNVNQDALNKVQTLLQDARHPFTIPDQALYSDSMPDPKEEETLFETYVRLMQHNTQVVMDAWTLSYQ